METHEDIVDQVHKYLTGQMESLEKVEFEQLLQTDTKYMEELRLQRGVDLITRAYRQMELRAELNDIADRVKKNPEGRRNSFLFTYLLIAASALILAGIWFYFQNKSSDSAVDQTLIAQELVNEHFQVFDLQSVLNSGVLRSDEPSDSPTGDSDNFSGDLETGMEFYMAGEYEKAIAALEQLNGQDANQAWAHLLLGISYLEIGEANAAVIQN